MFSNSNVINVSANVINLTKKLTEMMVLNYGRLNLLAKSIMYVVLIFKRQSRRNPFFHVIFF